jgi:hypothetical protein
MKYILVPNPKPPYNLRRFQPNYERLPLYNSEQELAEAVVRRNIEVGNIPADGLYWIVEDTDLPGGAVTSENDYFFDCWEWDDGCKVNMPKARGLHMNKIRAARNKELAKLDVPWMKAAEAGDTSTQSTIATQKQTLRDLPQTFDLTTDNNTEAELKAKWPSELPARE